MIDGGTHDRRSGGPWLGGSNLAWLYTTLGQSRLAANLKQSLLQNCTVDVLHTIILYVEFENGRFKKCCTTRFVALRIGYRLNCYV